MKGADLRVIFSQPFMPLRRPSPARYAAIWAIAWTVLLSCVAMELYTFWSLADAPALGARIRTTDGVVQLNHVDPSSQLYAMGARNGDRVLAIAGRPVVPSAFLNDPDDVPSWADRDLFFEWQKFMSESAEHSVLAIELSNDRGRFTVLCPLAPLGWTRSFLRTWDLHLVGWSFVLLPLIIWLRTQNETSLMTLVACIIVFFTLTTMGSYLMRDLCIDPTTLLLLTCINTITVEATMLALHVAMVMPTRMELLERHGWLRSIPWLLFVLAMVLRATHCFRAPIVPIYLFGSTALTGMLVILSCRYFLTRDPIVKAQLKWITLGAILGFLPWIALSGMTRLFGLEALPDRYTMLCAFWVPVGLFFAITRYRLLDVDRIFDWVAVHMVALSAFTLVEIAFWNFLSVHFAATSPTKPLMIAFSISFALVFYAPLRSLLLQWLGRTSGNNRPTLSASLQKLLERAQASVEPRLAIEQTLQWALSPERIEWFTPEEQEDALLAKLTGFDAGALGYQLDEDCSRHLQSAAWIPVTLGADSAAILLLPRGARGWNRSDLRLARLLVRASEPLLEMHRIQQQHRRQQEAMREQRDGIIREMHDGLGSQIFGASLLSNINDKMNEGDLRNRFHEVRDALSDAMDSLRTGLTVLSAPPGAFGPAILALLMRAERVLDAAGITLESEADEEATSLHLNSQNVFNLLRATQEALTNIARHSHASQALIRLQLQHNSLEILISDNGRGFDASQQRPGHGLANITHRMLQMHGKAAITSYPGGGCAIVLTLPVEQGEA